MALRRTLQMKKLTINDVLNDLGFTNAEKDGFTECVKAVKEEQRNDAIDSEELMESIIKEVTENENT